MNILFATLHLAPYVEISPAAEANASLSKALRLLGHEVTIVVPRAPKYEESGLMAARQLSPLVLADGREATVFDAQLPSGIKLALVEAGEASFRPAQPMEEQARALGTFAAAVVSLVARAEEQGASFDVVHAHECGAGLVLEHLHRAAGSALVKVLTVHDADNAGEFPREAGRSLGLVDSRLGAQGFGSGEGLGLLKGLVSAADLTVAPSPTYVRNLQAPEKFGSLARAFQGAEVIGIVQGVDHAVFNPSTDAALSHRYDAPRPENKGRNKSAILAELGLALELSRPVIFSEAVADGDCALATLLSAIPSLVRNDVTLIIAGKPEDGATAASTIEPFSDQIAWVSSPSSSQRRRLLAASDFYLSIQRKNPSGQSLMQAARYGAVPIALRADAAEDIVVDLDAELRTGTGMLFDAMTQRALSTASARAVAAYRSIDWKMLLSRVMRQDLAWDRSARRHVQLYERLGNVLA
jgi:starch synthase